MPLQIGEDGPEDEDEAEFERTIEIRRCGLRSSDYGKPEKAVARSSKRLSEVGKYIRFSTSLDSAGADRVARSSSHLERR